MIVLKILLAWLLADFLTGVVHWAQDILLAEPTRLRFLNRIRFDNIIHHKMPAAMLRHTLWGNVNTSVPLTVPLSILMAFAGMPLVLTLAVLFSSAANIIHRFAHIPKAVIWPPLRWIQATGLFISQDHHMKHHVGPNGLVMKEDTTGYYCPMTNWLNPALDYLGFWGWLEKCAGVRK